jgi:hypothetical protein
VNIKALFTGAQRANLAPATRLVGAFYSKRTAPIDDDVACGLGIALVNVIDIRVACVNRLQRPPIATIKQCTCRRNSRGSRRFWIAHYLRKRFDGLTRVLTGGILNIGQDSWPSLGVSRLARFEACASRSSCTLPGRLSKLMRERASGGVQGDQID